jgi:hypothetical protein
VREIVTNFNVEEIQVYDILKGKSEISNQRQNCSNVSSKRKLRRTGTEDISETVWEGTVSARARNFRTHGPIILQEEHAHRKTYCTIGNIN